MKGTVKLSFAIALALAGGNAFALGLGTITVKSGLNQPLDAEIPVISDSPAEAAALKVDLASAEDFQRVGLSRTRIGVPIEFAVAGNARGQTVIKLTTKEIVREPLLDFLIEVNWPKGKLLREYTVLLDPPLTAPVAKNNAPATASALPERPVAKPVPLAEQARPEPKPRHPPVKSPVVAAEPKAAPAPAPSKAPRAAASGEYGPVAAGETLGEIARATRPDDNTNINQLMLALLKSNPNAFYKDNINALKRGAILRIPSADEIKASGSMREAAAAVHSQNESWTSGNVPVATPTLVAHTGAPTKSVEKPALATPPAKEERLALVPPRAGKGSDTTADHAGSTGGTSKDSAEARAELTRTKEALTSRDQEAGELKSRVKQLEDLNTKDQRLITLKDSEIAELQDKLKGLQADSNKKPAAAAPAVSMPPAKTADSVALPASGTAANAAKPDAKTDQKITSKDIWGDLSGADKNASAKTAAPAMSGPAPAASSVAPVNATPTTTAPTTAGTAPSTAPSSSTTAPSATTPMNGTTAPATSASNPAAATTPPAVTSPSGDAASAVTPPPASVVVPASTPKPVKPVTPAKIVPLEVPAEPFYKNQNVLLAGGAALLLIGILALLRFVRRPKTVLVSPMGENEELVHDGLHVDEEEQRLLDALDQHPGDTALSLQLLQHYYAQGDAARFEAAADTMHAYITDPEQHEWQEVVAMGAVLVPHSPLFGGDGMRNDDSAFHDGHEDFVFDDTNAQLDSYDTAHTGEAVSGTLPDDSFDFDHLDQPPVREQVLPVVPVVVAAPAVPAVVAYSEADTAPTNRIDDFLVGEDAIGTKLDLAKAYLDMGDPEGAKSMLDEVLAEGNAMQKDEANKLLAEIK